MAEPTRDDTPESGPRGLEPEWGFFPVLDPVALGQTLVELGLALVQQPGATAAACSRWAEGLAAASTATASRTLGGSAEGPVAEEANDRRFRDDAWEENPAFFAVKQSYLLWSRLMSDLVEAADLDERQAGKSQFALDLLSNALAPTNFLPTNPTALRRAFDTGGASVARGMGNLANDIASNGGFPKQIELSEFELGVSLAATPGKVVYRNSLMELIQYEPSTKTVYGTPLICSPPWINKYYIMDLSPGRSFIEWAVSQGHTVFAISYANPDESHRDVTLDDYLVDGPRTAVEVVTEITGAPRVNLVGLCLGGTLTGILLAYLAAHDDKRVESATLLNTMLDFEHPGELGYFVDERTIERVEQRMAQHGFLEASDMATTFNLLRANDLIWSYVANNWLMGEKPPAFDILAWNADSTRMPATMHSFYLRACYLENQLATGNMEIADTKLDLAAADNDVYVLAAEEDHIAPWKSSYAATQLFGGDVRFVLTSSGHIAGIVNPPDSKRRYWTNDKTPAEPDDWRAGADEHPGTWWADWQA
ncbi:MAG: PHA/PHB synthase family protein, partial [Gaiellaceae bacterium]